MIEIGGETAEEFEKEKEVECRRKIRMEGKRREEEREMRRETVRREISQREAEELVRDGRALIGGIGGGGGTERMRDRMEAETEFEVGGAKQNIYMKGNMG